MNINSLRIKPIAPFFECAQNTFITGKVFAFCSSARFSPVSSPLTIKFIGEVGYPSTDSTGTTIRTLVEIERLLVNSSAELRAGDNEINFSIPVQDGGNLNPTIQADGIFIRYNLIVTFASQTWSTPITLVTSSVTRSRLLRNQQGLTLTNVNEIDTKTMLKYDLYLSRQSTLSGFSLTGEVSWFSDMDLGVEIVKSTLERRILILNNSKTGDVYESQKVVHQVPIKLNLDKGPNFSCFVFVKPPKDSIPTFETDSFICQYVMKVELNGPMVPVVTIEAPIVVVAASLFNPAPEFPATGMPFVGRKDSVNFPINALHDSMAVSKWKVVYPYFTKKSDEVSVLPDDIVLVFREFEDGFTLVKIVEQKQRPVTNGKIGFVPTHNLMELMERPDSKVLQSIKGRKNVNDSIIPPYSPGQHGSLPIPTPISPISNVQGSTSRNAGPISPVILPEPMPIINGSLSANNSSTRSLQNNGSSSPNLGTMGTFGQPPTGNAIGNPPTSPTLNNGNYVHPPNGKVSANRLVSPPTKFINPIVIDKCVSVETIEAHLLVLSRFNMVTNEIIAHQALTPNDVPGVDTHSTLFKDWRYLCRAELRYNTWITFLAREKPEPQTIPLPPLDVAMMWHAHMLSPLRYLEDTYRLFKTTNIPYEFPFLKMKQLPGINYEPDIHSITQWNRISTEPFKLSILHDETAPFKVNCAFCNVENSYHPATYVMYRMRDGKLNCTSCNAQYSAEMASAKYFLDDFVKFQLARESSFKGSFLDSETFNISATENRDFLQKLFSLQNIDSAHRAAYEVFTSMTKNSATCTWDKLIETYKTNILLPLKRGSIMDFRKPQKQFLDKVMASYKLLPCPNFSIDLIAAVIRQRRFEDKMCGGVVDWYAPGAMARATVRYHQFLALMASKKTKFMVPTLDIGNFLLFKRCFKFAFNYIFLQIWLGIHINVSRNVIKSTDSRMLDG
ncbi:hypothetical protein HK098_004419 [Nowakowskiella sp. JEL0407]|nr:hypothetical protein HK098_004419 [Nowakowskiella sp. JEL0407]